MRQRIYLGDSIYIEPMEGVPGGIKLTTENGGWEATNTIYLEPEVLEALKLWLEQPL